MNNDFLSLSELRRYLLNGNKKIVVWGAGYLGSNWAYSFLKDNGITVDYYCDNNKDLWGKRINDCKVISIDELIKKRSDIFVFVIIRRDQALMVLNQLENYGIEEFIEYTDLLHLQGVEEQYFPFMKDKSMAVYTCVTDDYDEIYEHDYTIEGCDYYVITDNPNNYKGSYQCIDIKDFLPPSVIDPTRQNRYCKINAHKIFPDYRYSVYYDANTIFIKDFSNLINKLPMTRLAVASTLFEDSIYGEAIRLINARRDEPDMIKKQMKTYWLKGMPDHFGQFWNYVLLREHNNPVCVKIMEDWWNEYVCYSKRDQLSLPYVIWKNGYSFKDVMKIDEFGEFWRRTYDHTKGSSRV